MLFPLCRKRAAVKGQLAGAPSLHGPFLKHGVRYGQTLLNGRTAGKTAAAKTAVKTFFGRLQILGTVDAAGGAAGKRQKHRHNGCLFLVGRPGKGKGCHFVSFSDGQNEPQDRGGRDAGQYYSVDLSVRLY